jgi:hypothetical protein
VFNVGIYTGYTIWIWHTIVSAYAVCKKLEPFGNLPDCKTFFNGSHLGIDLLVKPFLTGAVWELAFLKNGSRIGYAHHNLHRN